MRFLKNIGTGVVMAWSELLSKHGAELVECDKDGNALSMTANLDAAKTSTGGRIAKFVFNPATNVLIPYSDLLAAEPGLIPVDSREEADALLARLTQHEVVDTPVPAEPVLPRIDVGLPSPDDDIGNDLVDEADPHGLNGMDRKLLKRFAAERYGVQIRGNISEELMREQVRVLVLQDDAA